MTLAMNPVSFVDELVKVAALRVLYKRADDGEVNTVEIPHGMMSADPMPPSDLVHPAAAATRLPDTGHLPSTIRSGHLGVVTPAKNPIDREKFNRAYRERR